MGWDIHTISFTLTSSSHNSWKDDRDDLLIKDLLDRVSEIVNEPQYAGVVDDYMGPGEVFHPAWMPSPVWTVPLTNKEISEFQNYQRR